MEMENHLIQYLTIPEIHLLRLSMNLIVAALMCHTPVQQSLTPVNIAAECPYLENMERSFALFMCS